MLPRYYRGPRAHIVPIPLDAYAFHELGLLGCEGHRKGLLVGHRWLKQWYYYTSNPVEPPIAPEEIPQPIRLAVNGAGDPVQGPDAGHIKQQMCLGNLEVD